MSGILFFIFSLIFSGISGILLYAERITWKLSVGILFAIVAGMFMAFAIVLLNGGVLYS